MKALAAIIKYLSINIGILNEIMNMRKKGIQNQNIMSLLCGKIDFNFSRKMYFVRVVKKSKMSDTATIGALENCHNIMYKSLIPVGAFTQVPVDEAKNLCMITGIFGR